MCVCLFNVFAFMHFLLLGQGGGHGVSVVLNAYF